MATGHSGVPMGTRSQRSVGFGAANIYRSRMDYLGRSATHLSGQMRRIALVDLDKRCHVRIELRCHPIDPPVEQFGATVAEDAGSRHLEILGDRKAGGWRGNPHHGDGLYQID